MTLTTAVTAQLDREGVPYRRLEHTEAVYTVEAAARQRGVVLAEMVKSILLRDKDGHFIMACVAGTAQLDPGAVRAHVPPEWRRLTFADAAEILSVTGCVQGAVTPLNLPAHLPVIFDLAIADCRQVNISSGDPRLGLELAAADLIRLAQARLAPIARREG